MVARLLPLVLAAGLAAGCSSAPGPAGAPPAGATPAASSASLPAVAGLRVALEHAEQPAPGAAGAGQTAWRSTWRLSWDPAPGASSYLVRYGTNEGPGTRHTVLDAPSLAIEAAAGTSPTDRLEKDRRAGLLFTSSQLLVSVAARSGEATGPASLWFPVGDVPAGGQPLGVRDLGEHDAQDG